MADDLLGRAIQIAGRQVLCKHLNELHVTVETQKTISCRKLNKMLESPERAANEAAHIIRDLVDEVRKLRKEVKNARIKQERQRSHSLGAHEDRDP